MNATSKAVGVLLLLGASFSTSGHQTFSEELPPTVSCSIVLEVRTQVLAIEDLAPDATVFVLDRTRPIFNLFALRERASTASLTPHEVSLILFQEKELETSFVARPIHAECMPTPGRHLRAISSFRELPPDVLTLEFSNPIADPFADGGESHVGLFARFSMGGFGGTWYWVDLRQNNGSWQAATVTSLAVAE